MIRPKSETPAGAVARESEINFAGAGFKDQSTAKERGNHAPEQKRAIFAAICEEHGLTPGQIAGVDPSTYGMNRDEILAHAHQLQTLHGWQDWEIQARLTDPRTVTA